MFGNPLVVGPEPVPDLESDGERNTRGRNEVT